MTVKRSTKCRFCGLDNSALKHRAFLCLIWMVVLYTGCSPARCFAEEVPKEILDSINHPILHISAVPNDYQFDSKTASDLYGRIVDALKQIRSIDSCAVNEKSGEKLNVSILDTCYKLEWTPPNSTSTKFFSFDGKHGSSYDEAATQMIMFSGESATAVDIINKIAYSPLSLFQFAYAKGMRHDLNSLTNNAHWQDVLAHSVYVGTKTIGGRSFVVIRIIKCFDSYLDSDLTFDVYFDPSNLPFPYMWEAYDNDGMLVHKLVTKSTQVITDTGSLKISVPKSLSVYRSIWPGEMTYNGKTIKYFSDESTVRFDILHINSLSQDDLALDPAMANTIFDAEAKRFIPVPK